MKVEQGKSIIRLFFKIPLYINILNSSRQDLFDYMVVDRFIFKNNQITFSPSFPFIPKTGGLHKTGVRVSCVVIFEDTAINHINDKVLTRGLD